jgi:23S rRNA (uridine2552-2'-O)-methyltransferase
MAEQERASDGGVSRGKHRRNPYARADARTRQAKAQGYPARSVFKLAEIDRAYRLLRSGHRVLDLGAAPGSWTLYASQRVAPGGRVLAVDLQPMPQHFGSSVETLQGDVLELGTELARLGPYDVVLSDMAPSTSGTRLRDQALSYELFSAALQIALSRGRLGSSFVGKIFMGPDFGPARRAVAARFEHAHTVRPLGTRQRSPEVFLVGLGLRPAP